MQDEQGLAVARMLVKAGVPMFLARPNPQSKIGFDLPFGWETNEPDVSIVDAWRPGWALCAVTGHTFDLVDIDPRSGGDESLIQMPHIYLTAETPSGGRHHFVRTLGVSSLDGKVAAGIDVKSGTEDGVGRGFAFIAPTVRRSKVDGALGTYRWIVGPKGPVLPTPDQLAADGTGGMLRARVMELRRSSTSEQPRRVPQSVAGREWASAVQRLRDDVAHWQRNGWGGEAHSGILAATMHLARLDAERTEDAFYWAFQAAGAVPDASDLQKLHSAIERAVPDVVVPDSELSAAEAFFLGGDAPPSLGGSLTGPAGVDSLGAPMRSAVGSTSSATGDVFAPVTRERYRNRTPPPPATYGAFGGAQPLFYEDGVHWLQGESESGKTWVGLAVVADVLRQGGTALYIDHEDTLDRVLERLECLGVTDDEIERLVYLDPTSVTFRDIVFHVHDTQYSIMVVDGVTSSLSMSGMSGRDEQELTKWCDILPRKARMAICIDHVVKSKDDRDGMAVGTQAKKSVVTGSSFEVVCVTKFGRGTNGEIRLNLQKDKPGALRGSGIKSIKLHVVSDPAAGSVALVRPGAQSGSGTADFFAAGQQIEDTVKLNALTDKLTAYYTAGGTARPTVRSLVQVLRVELNVTAADWVLRKAAQRYTKSIGMPVEDDEAYA